MWKLHYYIECENVVPDKSLLLCVYPAWLKEKNLSNPWLQTLVLENGATALKFAETYGIVYSDYISDETTTIDDAARKNLSQRKLTETKTGKSWQLIDNNGAPTLKEADLNISNDQIMIKNATKKQIITGLTIVTYLPLYRKSIRPDDKDTHLLSEKFQIATSKYETADEGDPFVLRPRVKVYFGTMWELHDQDGEPRLELFPDGGVKQNSLIIKNSSRGKVALGLFIDDIIAVIRRNVWVDTRASFSLLETSSFYVGISDPQLESEPIDGNMLKNKISVKFDNGLNYVTVTLSPSPFEENPPQLEAKCSFKNKL
ncbi:13854_t:CDS:2 [Ambispora leptoticha]|uniref:13854_t:CDS:1 n=1 Tax=Ambispora leptoticha TaxID=144679 RepID=A0A9N8V2R4_9GLOM|nr:13854_t:CDS:2 [Ambispora leptoticha]